MLKIPRAARLLRAGRRGRILAVLAARGAASVAVAAGGGTAGAVVPTQVYTQSNLVSDIPGVARITDPNLVNPWGLAAGPTTPLWIANNGTNTSTLYTGGVNGSIPAIVPLVVGTPDADPSGLVFNPSGDFLIHQGDATVSAKFIFDSESGKILAWAPTMPPAANATVVDSSPDAVYKGLAIAKTSGGWMLYATNFHQGEVEVYNSHFKEVTPPGSFEDPNIPEGFAPFGIQAIGGMLYVTYAKQDEARHDDVAGPGNGFVDVYDLSGHLVKRLISQGDLNSPWGLALAPAGFGAFSGDLLVGNFGDGMIHAYDPSSGAEQGTLTNADGNPITISGLWGLMFGNGVAGTPTSLLFTAGLAGESHGLFGEINAG
jgi:uncharacterized protein (TIGR03118 family)